MPRILLSFSHSRETADILSYPQTQRTSNSFLYFTKAKTRLMESVSQALSTLSQYFQVYNKVSNLVERKEQYRNNTVDSLCFKSAG